MFRCFTISTLLHIGVVLTLLILAFIAPPIKKMPPITRINLNTRGIPGLPERPPSGSNKPGSEANKSEPPAPVAEEPAPTPKPASTPKPAATPAPKPTEAKKQIVNPKTTPKPEVAEKKAPTVKRPEKKIAEPVKKRIVIPDKKKRDVITRNLKPTPTPKPTPKEEMVAEVTENDTPAVPEKPEVAAKTEEFDKPSVPAAPDVPDPPPSVPAVGPGGNGTGQKLSPHGALSGGIGVGTPGSGGGGGAGGNFGGYGYGTILNDLAQTYFAIVLQKIEENFKLPYSRPGVQCLVQFQIEKTGQITNIQVAKSSGYPNLDSLAVQALQMTRLPALYDGIKVNALPVTLTFNYDKKE